MKNGSTLCRVDNIEVAQLVYLLLDNSRISGMLNTIVSKIVLILGRFGPRLQVLEHIRTELRKLGYVPVIFDFDAVAQQTLLQTVTTLAKLSRFIIVDISDAKCAQEEVTAILHEENTAPVILLWQYGTEAWGMATDMTDAIHARLVQVNGEPVFCYSNSADLTKRLDIITQLAEEAADQLRLKMQATRKWWQTQLTKQAK